MPNTDPNTPPATQHHRPVVFDEEPACGSAGTPQGKPKRRRGRPLGAKTRTEHGHVSADEIAFLRALAQGVDLSVASRQYLLWPGRMPERAALEQFARQLLQRVAAGALTLDDRETAHAKVRDLQALLPWDATPQTLVHQDSTIQAPLLATPDVRVAPPVSAAPPSLEEFASQYPDDMFGEAELLEMYEAEYPVGVAPVALVDDAQIPLALPQGEGVERASVAAPTVAVLAPVSAAQRIEVQLSAIDWLGERLAVVPELDHPISQWIRLNEEQRQAMKSAGLITLRNLVDWIALRGERWFRGMPRYGVGRARGLEAWLLKWHLRPSVGLPAIGQQLAKATDLVVAHAPGGLVPLPAGPAPVTEATWPRHLWGEEGGFRSGAANTLAARNDLEAVQGWFRLIERRSPATQAGYRRAIERLIMWAVHEKDTALSALSNPDLQDFHRFLSNPPPHWINPKAGTRRNKGDAWRPLRGPLNEGSLNLTFAAIGSMYAAWRAGNYLTANPADGIATGPGREEASLDTNRSLSEQDLELVAITFQHLPDGPSKRRLVAILLLLETSGLRRAELEGARWGAIARARVDGRDTNDWLLTVVGKRNKKRVVPVHPDAMHALLAHRQDRRELYESGLLQQFGRVAEKDQPLIGVLDERRSSRRASPRSSEPADADGAGRREERGDTAEVLVSVCGELSAPAIYAELKRFFAQCADGSSDKDQKERFLKASTHWMRHTFAHHLLRVTDKNLAIVQKALGHSSMATTAIYVKADQKETIAAVAAIKSTLGPG